MLVGVLSLFRKGVHEPVALGAGCGVDKDVKAPRLSGQRAGRSPAHQDAVALLRRVRNLSPNQL